MKDCPLVLVEWEDSAQPISQWQLLSDLHEAKVIECVSVGWMLRNTKKLIELAPNMGSIHSETNIQASGIIQIPMSCIKKIKKLKETR